MQTLAVESTTALLRNERKSDRDAQKWKTPLLVIVVVGVVVLCGLIGTVVNKSQGAHVTKSNALVRGVQAAPQFLAGSDLRWVRMNGQTCPAACKRYNSHWGATRSGKNEQRNGEGYYVCAATNTASGFAEHGHASGKICYAHVGVSAHLRVDECLCKKSGIPSMWVSNRGIDYNCHTVCTEQGMQPVSAKNANELYVCSTCITGWGCRSGSNTKGKSKPYCKAASGIRLDPVSMSCLCVLYDY